MELLTLHRRAKSCFAEVLQNIGAGQLEASTPCTEWKVRDVIAHVIAGDYKFSGHDAPPMPSDIEELIEAHVASAAIADAAFSAPDGLEREYRFTSRVVPGRIAIHMRSRDAFVHGWDLARATGQSTDLDPDIAMYLLGFSRQEFGQPQGNERRGPGLRYAVEQPTHPQCTKADELAAFLGRRIG